MAGVIYQTFISNFIFQLLCEILNVHRVFVNWWKFEIIIQVLLTSKKILYLILINLSYEIVTLCKA